MYTGIDEDEPTKFVADKKLTEKFKKALKKVEIWEIFLQEEF